MQASQELPKQSDSQVYWSNPGKHDIITQDIDIRQMGSRSSPEVPVPFFDFDEHPGHRYWEWIEDRQRWHRRGASLDGEDNWFPEEFA